MKTQDLLQSTMDDLGLEAYHYYKGERHSFEVEILTGIAGSIIFEYLKGIINFEKLGEMTKAKLLDLFNSMIKQDESDKVKKVDEIVKEINDNGQALDFSNENRSVDGVKKYLMSINFPERVADKKAKKISEKLKKEIKNETI